MVVLCGPFATAGDISQYITLRMLGVSIVCVKLLENTRRGSRPSYFEGLLPWNRALEDHKENK
jgi:hypothetical protein